MTAKGPDEGGHRVFVRFGISGIVFTILGPLLFWLAYPMGPFIAVVIAELLVHTVRFTAFRKLVFPSHKGYQVSLPRYALSALPVSVTGMIVVGVLRNWLDRTALTLTGALIAMVVGFVWSRYVYSQPSRKR